MVIPNSFSQNPRAAAHASCPVSLGRYWTAFLLLGLLFMLASGSVAAPSGNAAEARAKAESLTKALVGLAVATERAGPHAVSQLRAVAAERHDLLIDMMERDPGGVLRVAIPRTVRRAMPTQIQDLLERELVLEGDLEVRYSDFPDGTSQVRHFLDAYGERVALHFAAAPPGLTSGIAVSARGVMLGDAMALASGEELVTLALTDTGAAAADPAAADYATVLPNTFGEQRTVVLLVNFTADSSEPWTVQQAHDIVFGDASDFFWENSYGQTWLDGDVFGWFTITIDPTGCPSMDIALAARQAATAQGIDLSGYDRYIYAFPDIGCSWSGEGTVGGSTTHAWLDGTLGSPSVVTHELGHNLGLMHSHALACGDQPLLSDGCISVEYGDVLDRMGSTSGGHFSAFQKQRLGWLGYGASPPLATADVDGVYQLDSYAAQTDAVKALRVPRDLDPASGQQRWYYLEARQAVGFDDFLATSRYGESATNGVVFQLGTEGGANSSFRLDMTPASQYYDWDDLALAEGASFHDPVAGVTVTAQWVAQTGTSVSVSFDLPQCVHLAPAVSLSPSQGPWVQAGTPVSYDVTVTNNDGALCDTANFDLAVAVPIGWAAGFDASVLTLSPGASATRTLNVSSASFAADGYYDLAITATNRDLTAYAGSASATYVVSAAAGNHAPQALDDTVTTVQGVSVTIDVLANDSDPDGNPLAVVAVDQPARGEVTMGPGGTLIYTPAKKFKGTETFGYTVSDGQASADATVNVSVISDAGSGGGSGGGKGGGNRGK